MYHLSGGRKLPNADKEDRSNKALPEIQIFTLMYKNHRLKQPTVQYIPIPHFSLNKTIQNPYSNS